MKRRDLLRHLEKQGCEFLREGGNHRFTSTVARRNRQQFRGIARSSISSRARSAKTWTFPSRDFPRTFLARRSLGVGGCSMCGPHFCSMKITEDVRKFAADQQISEEQALEVGLKEKANEFMQTEDGLYSRV